MPADCSALLNEGSQSTQGVLVSALPIVEDWWVDYAQTLSFH